MGVMVLSHLKLATQFASLGYSVFPLYRGRNNTKLKPYGWAKNQVVDPDKVDKVIAATDQVDEVQVWPELIKRKYKSEIVGFGVLGSGCVIIDLDVKGNKNGFEEFDQLKTAYNIPSPTMVTVTKSGGLHVFYKKPKQYKDFQLKTLSGIQVGTTKYPSIDLRGDGGFVIGPDMLVDNLSDVSLGLYGTKGVVPISELPEFPAKLLLNWLRPTSEIDAENLMWSGNDDDDYKALIRRGQIPNHVPKGARNESFFVFINVLKSKGVPPDVTKHMCLELAKRVEEPETLAGSVSIDEIIKKVYIINKDNPYDVAVDLLNIGLFQVTGQATTLRYVILEDNPYIASKSLHDEMSMKTLLLKYQKSYKNEKGKDATLNPINVVTKLIGNENRVDMLGFRPNAGEVFSLHDDPGSKRFLNTFRPLIISHKVEDLDDTIWDEFMLLISRLFGPDGSEGYQLGLDFVSWLVQKPEVKPSIAPFIMSQNRGVGKSLFFNVLIQIMGTSKDGERQARLLKLDEITGRFFNPSGCAVNLIDEVQFAVHRDTRKESTAFWRHLKNLITAETVPVEIKGGATYQCPNSAAVALAGNFGSYFPIEEFDRRLWIIDNNPPLLQMGTVDKLFALVKSTSMGIDDRQRLISTLRYKLKMRKIELDLGSIRAPMTDTKRELYENSLTDLEEWFVTHFSDTGNVFAFTPVISQSAVAYVYDQSGRSSNESVLNLFRDLKRKGYLRPIKTKKTPGLSRQFTVMTVGLDGSLFQATRREILYTTREHGEFDDKDSTLVIELYGQNCATIQRHKQQRMAQTLGTRKIKGDALLNG